MPPSLLPCGTKRGECTLSAHLVEYTTQAHPEADKTCGLQHSALWTCECAGSLWMLLCVWKVPLYCIFWVEDFALKLLVELSGLAEADMRSL